MKTFYFREMDKLDAKGYRVNKSIFMPLLYYQFVQKYYSNRRSFGDWAYITLTLFKIRTTPKHFFLEENISTWGIIYNNLINCESPLEQVGFAYSTSGFYEQALVCFRKLLKLRETHFARIFSQKRVADAWYDLSIAYFRNSQLEEARDAITKSIQLNPKDNYSWKVIGDIFAHINEADEAVNAYRKAIALKPKNAASWIALANHYRNVEKYEDALKAFETARKLQKDSKYIWNDIGNIYNDLDRLDEAIEAYKKQININEDEVVLGNLGITYLRKGLVKAAINTFERAIMKKEDAIYAHLSA